MRPATPAAIDPGLPCNRTSNTMRGWSAGDITKAKPSPGAFLGCVHSAVPVLASARECGNSAPAALAVMVRQFQIGLGQNQRRGHSTLPHHVNLRRACGQAEAFQGRRGKSGFGVGHKLVKIRIAGKRDRLADSERPMSAGEPACGFSFAVKLRKRCVRSAIRHGEKRLDQRTNGDLALRMLPSLGHDVAIFVEQKKRKIRIRKLPGQCGRRRLGAEVLRST